MSTVLAAPAARRIRDLTKLLAPQSVAVVGATARQDSVGYAVLHNLLFNEFQGTVYPVNPKRKNVLGVPTVASISAIPEPPDMAILIVPPQAVIDVTRECAAIGTKDILVISAGFKEIGAEGLRLEQELRAIVAENEMNLIGPNCLGIINADPAVRFNATFARTMPKPGRIGFMSQSGALCTAILDYAKGKDIAFSKFISFGNKADVDEVDLLQALGDDPQTDVILMYLEDLSDARRFIQVARQISGEAEQPKPILAIKSGRTAQGARAAASHTGSLAGTDAVYEAILTQAGVVRCETVEELFDYAMTFSTQPLPKGDRIGIVTNAGGPGIMATDACIRAGLQVPELDDATKAALKPVLPPTAALNNPVDVIGDAQADRYAAALETLLQSDQLDALVVLLTPQNMTEIEKTAEAVAAVAQRANKPVIPAFMGSADICPAEAILRRHGLFNFAFPESAIRSLKAMAQYRGWLLRPRSGEMHFTVRRDDARAVIETALREGRSFIPEPDAVKVLEAYGFPTLPAKLARTRDEAVAAARAVEFPVVMKIVSPDIVHKTDIGGVMLNLTTPEQVADAWDAMMQRIRERQPKADITGVFIQRMAARGRECILGANRDARFGPVIMFGLGGVYVEAFKDVTFRLAPVRPLGAERMIQNIKSYPILRGVRGEAPADMPRIAECLERLSQLCMENPEIQELDINPLIVYAEGNGAAVADVRIILNLQQ